MSKATRPATHPTDLLTTNSNTNVNSAFEMVSPASAVVNSTTAGCNFNNTVTLTKANGAQGLRNLAAGGYDSNQFQANIPYSVGASFTATTNTSANTALRFSCRPEAGRRKLAWRGELLRKARVYVCKPERWLKQRSFKTTEECSC